MKVLRDDLRPARGIAYAMIISIITWVIGILLAVGIPT